MRVIVLLALLLGSMWTYPRPLDPPELVAAPLGDCEVMSRNGLAIAHALGYANAGYCGHGILAERITPRAPMVPGLIAYSGNERWPNGAPLIGTTLEVPSDIPFVATTGSIIGYVKLDALLLSLGSDNPVEEALALHDAGIATDDIVSLPERAEKLLVRVRPVTPAQVLKIISVAKQYKSDSAWPVYWSLGFVANCENAIAGLGALAVNRAREHAAVMAAAAHARLGDVLGVVDAGSNIPDAVCDVDVNSPTRKLAVAGLNARLNRSNAMQILPRFYATIFRSLDVAWRVQRPPNSPGMRYLSLPQFSGRWWLQVPRPAFVADGKQVHGDALIPNAFEPDRARIILPQWAAPAMLKSRWASAVSWAFESSTPHLALDLRARQPKTLQHEIDSATAFLSAIKPPTGQSLDLTYWYSRTDCSAAIDTAIFRATQDALAKTGGTFRYLWGRELDGFALGQISCTYEPDEHDQWLTTGKLPHGGAGSEIIAGY